MRIKSIPEESILSFRSKLLSWGEVNILDYPWRFISDPYRVLISEFMLHRTQTRQVVPIFQLFIHAYPNLPTYAIADKEEVKKGLKPLGLNWRIEGMIQALCTLWDRFGNVPLDYDSLLSIQGIGQYIASATICFTQNIPLTLIDSNIVRVIGRVGGFSLSGEARRRKEIIQAVSSVCDPLEPQRLYYSIIDLSHLICRPRSPLCHICPLLTVPCWFGQSYQNGA